MSKANCPSGPLEQVMGAGYLVGKKAKYGDSETQVLAGVCGKAPTDAVFTWAIHENTKLAAAGDGVHAVLRSLELIASGAERPFDQ